jgi:hypothetical protein
MKVRTYICLGALALATLMAGACKSAPVAETKEIQTQRTKDLAIVLLNEKGELTMGQNRFIVAFHSVADGKPVDVGSVTIGSTMTMPGMTPMTASIELAPAEITGQYIAKGNFAMSGSWKFEVRWNGPAGSGATSFHASVR